jgi:hypothetical protein
MEAISSTIVATENPKTATVRSIFLSLLSTSKSQIRCATSESKKERRRKGGGKEKRFFHSVENRDFVAINLSNNDSTLTIHANTSWNRNRTTSNSLDMISILLKTWLWLLPASATNHQNQQRDVMDFSPTIRTKLPWTSKMCNLSLTCSLTIIFPSERIPTPIGPFNWPFPFHLPKLKQKKLPVLSNTWMRLSEQAAIKSISSWIAP